MNRILFNDDVLSRADTFLDYGQDMSTILYEEPETGDEMDEIYFNQVNEYLQFDDFDEANFDILDYQ